MCSISNSRIIIIECICCRNSMTRSSTIIICICKFIILSTKYLFNSYISTIWIKKSLKMLFVEVSSGVSLYATCGYVSKQKRFPPTCLLLYFLFGCSLLKFIFWLCLMQLFPFAFFCFIDFSMFFTFAGKQLSTF